jgi:hypothetical protein
LYAVWYGSADPKGWFAANRGACAARLRFWLQLVLLDSAASVPSLSLAWAPAKFTGRSAKKLSAKPKRHSQNPAREKLSETPVLEFLPLGVMPYPP